MSFPRRTKAKKIAQNTERGVGDLSRVPDFFRTYTCDVGKKGSKCGTVSAFASSSSMCGCRTKSKYRAQPVIVGNLRFDSLTEARRYSRLLFLETEGVIRGLQANKKDLRYPMIVNGVKVADYVADFRYTYFGETIVEDTKGMVTPVFRLKLKLLEALYPGLKLVIL